MIIDGKAIAEKIKKELKLKIDSLKTRKGPLFSLSLDVVFVGDNSVSEKYISRKKKFGEEVGVAVNIHTFDIGISEQELIDKVKNISKNSNGVIVQLPLPSHINSDNIINSIPYNKDIDALSAEMISDFLVDKSPILPPVVGAVKEILDFSDVSDLSNLSVVVIGKGRLVGKPASVWFKNRGAHVEMLDKESGDLSAYTKFADIIVTGAGVPNLITPEMLPEKKDSMGGKGVVIIDAATSEVSGKLVGDADPKCAEKCSVFSPVPGGVGPITIAMLFKNLLILNEI